MKGEQLASLGKKAFALVAGVNPEQVTFEEGVLYHKCRAEHSGGVIEGNFYHWLYHDDDSGTVCITMKQTVEPPFWHYPHTWHHLWGINSPEPFIN